MATPLTGIDSPKVSFKVSANSKQALEDSTPSDVFSFTHAMSFAFGSGASEFDLVWHDTRIIAASQDDELDLAASLVDGFGNTLTWANIKVMMIVNLSDRTLTSPSHSPTAAVIDVGGTAANQFNGPFADPTDIITLGAGDAFLVTRKAAGGMTVTADTGDKFLIAETAALEAAYFIALFGDST